MYDLIYKGGVPKNMENPPKFLLFARVQDKDLIFMDALRSGVFTPKQGQFMHYNSLSSSVKVFSSWKDMGRMYYYSTFLELDEGKDLITICPTVMFNANHGFIFEARGEILSGEAIMERWGEENYRYYRRQAQLTESALNRMITIKKLDVSGEPLEIRKLRI